MTKTFHFQQPPTILSIDTSCDETSVAVTQSHTVLSNIIASQTQLHQPYGGVFPTVAKQAHKENIDPAINAALKRAKVTWDRINAIAVTQGPGLAPALEVGIKKAIQIAKQRTIPIIAVNHIEGHVLSPLVEPNKRKPTKENSHKSITFPILSVIVSGGHTQFILIERIGSYRILGTTIDDAAGEALDKVGRMLDLGYPAGPVIEEFAKLGSAKKYSFPLPMTSSGDFNLSFSGLKTFSRRLIEKKTLLDTSSKQIIFDFCASFQYAVFRHICHKLNKVLQDHQNITQVWLGGGVAANIKFREMVRQTVKQFVKNNPHQPRQKIPTQPIASNKHTNPAIRIPYTKKVCGDNAAMIGIVAYYKYQKNEFVKNQDALDRKPKWDI